MARQDEKHVSFDEPLLVKIINVEEEVKPSVDRKRTRYLALVFLAVVICGIFGGGSAVRACRHIQHKHAHMVKPVVHHSNLEPNSKPSLPTIERPQPVEKRADPGPICTTSQCTDYAARIKGNLASNYAELDPCDDFDKYVCEGWRAKHPFKPDESLLNTGFLLLGSIIKEENTDILHQILEGGYVGNASQAPAKIAIAKENFGKMKIVYNTCMDEAAIKAYGIKPMRDLFDQFEKIYPAAGPEPSADKEGLTKALVWLSKIKIDAVLSAAVGIDDKDPDAYVINIGLAETGIKTRRNYNNPELVANYTRAMAQMFQIMSTGQPIPKASLFKDPEKPEYMEKAKLIVALEKKFAKASPDPEIAGSATYFYNVTSITDIQKMVPEIDVGKLVDELKPAAYTPKFILNSDYLFVGNVSAILKSTPREVLQGYMQYLIIDNYVSRLDSDYRLPVIVFKNSLAGRDPFIRSERWKVCLNEVQEELGWILSAAFLEKADFTQDAKALGDRIISDIKAEFAARLKTLDWMSPKTQDVAVQKVKNMVQKIGYPTASPNIMDPEDLQKHYDGLRISDDYFANSLNLNTRSHNKTWENLLKPVDRVKWEIYTPVVNAYYNPSGNEIVFPAGIMRKPYFGVELPEYVSYGSFGSIAGHETTHGFDNNGANYDEKGQLAVWWDDATIAEFDKKKQCFVDQYSKYTVVVGGNKTLHVNGELTLPENIADSGGANAAFRAWQKRNAEKPNPLLPGLEKFTREQMFFISFATSWCGHARPETRELLLNADVHSPDKYRILGTMNNTVAFREAFQCKDKKPTCQLW
ncbi:hypothetical protein FKW77_003728 [Venturia effusa]|uniref:Endothelin-converting enzyme 1 n=1 Tax=Venturia effusa TaxID=50376 RepID=A0A517LR13_9PEZI|nr:hypothetical protein FKW77_003728 [Venturia effusa]